MLTGTREPIGPRRRVVFRGKGRFGGAGRSVVDYVIGDLISAESSKARGISLDSAP